MEELEHKLRTYEQQGVRATQEIQAAALQVVEQNIRLKKLLRSVGVDDSTVQAWLQGEEETPSLPNTCSHCTKTEVCCDPTSWYNGDITQVDGQQKRSALTQDPDMGPEERSFL